MAGSIACRVELLGLVLVMLQLFGHDVPFTLREYCCCCCASTVSTYVIICSIHHSTLRALLGTSTSTRGLGYTRYLIPGWYVHTIASIKVVYISVRKCKDC